jgi:D-aminopeptidase
VRVIIISDMEGVAGVTKWDEVSGGEPLHADRSRLYTEEINAAVRGAYNGGATEVVVMDCHGAGKGWTFNSLIPEQLDPACEFVVQQEWKDLAAVKPYDPGRPFEIRVVQNATDATDKYARKHGVEVVDPRTIVSRGDDW